MNNPFEVLGLKGLATPDEIRSAYRTLARKCHPDMITDPAEKEAAQTRMVALNLAYEEALRLASPRTGVNTVTPELSSAESILMAQRAMAKDNPEGALRSLVRCEKRDGEWYYMQGKVLMGMAGMTVTDERKESVDFTTSYATGVQVIIVKEDSPIKNA